MSEQTAKIGGGYEAYFFGDGSVWFSMDSMDASLMDLNACQARVLRDALCAQYGLPDAAREQIEGLRVELKARRGAGRGIVNDGR